MQLPSVNLFSWMKFAQLDLTAAERLAVYRKLTTEEWEMKDIFLLEADAFARHFPQLDYAVWHEATLQRESKAAFKRLPREIEFLPINHARYPTRIKQLLKAEAPPLFYLSGHTSLVTTPQVAIVGRRDTSYGVLQFAEAVGAGLANAGWTVAAGYESGIAEAALKGTLEADGTVAAYPAGGIHDLVWKTALQTYGWQRNHLVLSPFRPGRSADEQTAALRNRYLAAVSKALILIEDAPDSEPEGRRYEHTIEAARWALDYEIPLFVMHPEVAGYPLPGNEAWARRGATVFKTVAEVVAAIEPYY